MLNQVNLIGNVGQEPEVRFTPAGDKVVTISVATSRRWKDRNTNEKKEETEWHRVVAFGKIANVIAEYVVKGAQIFISGRLKTTKYQKDGQDHYSTDIVAENVKILGKKSEGSGQSSRPVPEPSGNHSAQSSSDDGFDDDIPF